VLAHRLPWMLGRMAPSRNSLRSTSFAAFEQTRRVRRLDARCARRAMRPALLGASTPAATDRRTFAHYPGMDAAGLGRGRSGRWCPEGSDLCDEQRRAGVGARSAHLTSDSPRLFERNERANEASYAARPGPSSDRDRGPAVAGRTPPTPPRHRVAPGRSRS